MKRVERRAIPSVRARPIVHSMGRGSGGTHEEHPVRARSDSGANDGPLAAVNPDLLASARKAALVTFADFEEDPRSAFAIAPGRTEEETWHEIRGHVAETAALALTQALTQQPVTPSMLDAWHERIFSSTFPEAAGRRRSGRRSVYYTYVVAVRPDGELQTAGGTGTGARSLTKRLRKSCVELNETAARFDAARSEDAQTEALPSLREVTRAAAKFYTKFLSAHPYPDGNGRTAYVALQYALVRLGATGVELADFAEQQVALGRALRTDARHSYEPLAILLERKIRSAAESPLR
jgi:fido (protein-threonine AMPylation protein)